MRLLHPALVATSIWLAHGCGPTQEEEPFGEVFVPPGEYVRGAEGAPGSSFLNHCSYGTEAFTVRLTRGVWFHEAELTVPQVRSLLGAWPSECAQVRTTYYVDRGGTGFRRADSPCPAVGMGWFVALRVANLMSDRHGLSRCYHLDECEGGLTTFRCERGRFDPDCSGYRLPTDSEWEYAARAGRSGHFGCEPTQERGDWASDCLSDYASVHPLYGSADSVTGLDYGGYAYEPEYPVRLYAPNPWGIYDVIGNASEWVFDAWSSRAAMGLAPQTGLHTDPVRPGYDFTAGDHRGQRTVRSNGWGRNRTAFALSVTCDVSTTNPWPDPEPRILDLRQNRPVGVRLVRTAFDVPADTPAGTWRRVW